MAQLDLKAIISAEDNASSTISKVGGAFGTLAKIGLAGAIAGVGALTYALKKSIDEFTEGEKLMAQTNAVLKSTKGIAGVTAYEINKMNDALSTSTMFNDDMVRTGQNMLLTFTNIGKDVFPQATETMLDMSQALGQDVKSSSIQLGKALQDPILGVTALRRVGVNFNESQADLIRKMVESNDIMGAQTYILEELQTEFGGSAKAAGETFAGKVAILNQHIDNLKETVGGVIVEAITPFISKLNEWASDPSTQQRIRELAEAFGDKLKEGIRWAKEKLDEFQKWYANGGKDTLLELADNVMKIATAFATVIGWVGSAISWFYKYKDLLAQIARIQQGVATVGISEGIRALSRRAAGGPVSSGTPYIVGEKGPELFVPSGNGRIIPNNQVSNSVSVNFYGNINNTSNASLDDIGKRISRQIQLASQGI